MAQGTLEYCLWALIERMQDGTVQCPLIDCMGCEECYEAWQKGLKYEERE